MLEQELSVRFLAGDPVEIKTAYNGLMRTGSELGVDMPITRQVYRVLYEALPAQEAVEALLSRDPRHE